MTITPQEVLTCCIEHCEIFHDEMLHLMRLTMRGEMSPIMAAALTMGLHVKKGAIDEIAVAVTVMREFVTKADVPAEVSDHLADIVGTDGNGVNTFNTSTAPVFVAAAVGVRIAKYDGRDVSSKPGSADVLKALGVNIMLTSEQVAESIEMVGIGFMFVPNHRPTMKNVAPTRKELSVRMIFNTLGLLINPTGAPSILMGAFYPDLVGIQVCVMQRLGAKHAVVVYGKDDVDEVSPGAAMLVRELKDGVVTEYGIHPEDSGLQMASNCSLKMADVDESKTMLIEALENEPGTPREIASLNAGVALYVANIVGSIGDGMKLACEAAASGAVHVKLDELVRVTNQFKA